jgi:reactive intermediate/imine deaminase
MDGKPIQPDSFDIPRGHYSPGFVTGNLLFVSGQLPISKGATPDAAMPFEAQARLVLANVLTVVATAGGKLTDIAKVNVYITDVALWPEFNRVYAEVFGNHKPARAVVPVPALNYGMKLEVEAVANLG